MKYQKTIDANTLDFSRVQVGQWVNQSGAKGQYVGTKPNGSHVVIWQGNLQAREDKKAYRKSLIDYAKAK